MDDVSLLQAFETCRLTPEQWTHRTHVKVAYLYLRRYPFETALERMRCGIKALNASLGVPNSPTEGYHETTTHAFMHLIAATIAAYEPVFPTSSADAFCDTHPHLLNRHVLRLFFSPQRRMEPEAKNRFIEPDLAPLPKILIG
jgi:hypothetical protein